MKMYKYCLNFEMNYFPIIYIMLNRIIQTLHPCIISQMQLLFWS